MFRTITQPRILLMTVLVVLLAGVILASCGAPASPSPTAQPTPAATATPAVRTTTANYAYDAAGRLTQVEYANGVVITYTYDKAWNLLSSLGNAVQKSRKDERF